MAMNRAPFNALVDDDGSNTIGTVWNKTQIQSVILDPADAAFSWTSTTSTTTGVQNNFNPGLNAHTLVRLAVAAPLTITGLAAGFEGQIVRLVSYGASRIDLSHNDARSAAANRLYNYATSGPTSLLGGYAEYQYSTVDAMWWLRAHEQGAWITPVFNAADYLGSGTSWTVAAGNVAMFRYRLSGKTLEIMFNLTGTSVGGAAPYLHRYLPGGFTSVNAATTLMQASNIGAPIVVGIVWGSGNLMTFNSTVVNGGWSAGAGTGMNGTAIYELS